MFNVIGQKGHNTDLKIVWCKGSESIQIHNNYVDINSCLMLKNTLSHMQMCLHSIHVYLTYTVNLDHPLLRSPLNKTSPEMIITINSDP